jgi:hypothetical protein
MQYVQRFRSPDSSYNLKLRGLLKISDFGRSGQPSQDISRSLLIFSEWTADVAVGSWRSVGLARGCGLVVGSGQSWARCGAGWPNPAGWGGLVAAIGGGTGGRMALKAMPACLRRSWSPAAGFRLRRIGVENPLSQCQAVQPGLGVLR